ncbi:hypothetical protein M9H77_23455 [Catharanthus roseus]|uniref:Uncharacterized protein n=1 Tax=Catharanthus roseus TaxID=4058 RepID=A0ACC0AUK7_CATRO|nr:hypothetical protein M9H77_23455 [Catharanthus roseus]
MGLHEQSLDPQNEAIGTKFRYLVVNTGQTPYERSITKQPHSHITGQNRLQTPRAPTRCALGPTLVPPQSMMRRPRKYRLGHTLKVLLPSSSGSTLRVKNPSTSSEEALSHPEEDIQKEHSERSRRRHLEDSQETFKRRFKRDESSSDEGVKKNSKALQPRSSSQAPVHHQNSFDLR